MYQQVFRTGKHRRRKNPDGPETKRHPELAHLTAEEHAELLNVMNALREVHDCPRGEESPLWNRPRSRSLWPGQHARCGVCGGRMYRYGKVLRCQNAVPKGPRTCWNHVFVDMAVVREKVFPWVLSVPKNRAGVRAEVVRSAWQEFGRIRRRQERAGGDIELKIKEMGREADNLADAIARGGNLDALVRKSAEVDAALKDALREKARQEQQAQAAGEFLSPEDIDARLEDALTRLVLEAFDFADLLRRLLPEFVIQPVQALDTPQVRPRAKLTLRPDAWSDAGGATEGVSATLDLFDPPIHAKHMAACVAIKEAMPSVGYEGISRELGINRMTVKRSLAYHRLMRQEGLSDPYREIHVRPETASRWKDKSPNHSG